MTKEQLAALLETKIIGYRYEGNQLVMDADLGNGVSIEIKLDDMPVGMAEAKRKGAEYIAERFLSELNNPATSFAV